MKKIKPFFFKLLLLIMIGCILFYTITVYIVEKYSQQIIYEITNHISNKFEKTSVYSDPIKFIFLPLPKFYLTNIIIKTNDDDSIYIEECVISPNITQLLKGSICFSSIKLIKPITIVKDSRSNMNYHLELIHNIIASNIQYLLDAQFIIADGRITVFYKEKPLIDLSGINYVLNVSNQHTINTNLEILSIACSDELSSMYNIPQLNSNWSIKDTHIKIKNFQIKNTSLISNRKFDVHTWLSNFGTPNFELSTFIDINNTPHKFTLLFNGSIKEQENKHILFESVIETKGHVSINNNLTPVYLYLPFSIHFDNVHKSLPEINIHNAKLELDTDSLYLNGTLKNYTKLSHLLFSGNIEVKKLSLPCWFTFAQELPVGLQHALDQLSGTMTFLITPQKLDISSIKIHALDIELNGTASVANFSQPVIAMDLKTDNININNIFPETKEETLSPTLHHTIKNNSQIESISTPNDKTQSAGVGYDIRIHADHADFLEFTGNNFFFHIYPEANAIKLNANYKNFYNGTILSSLSIYDDDIYSIKLDLTNIQANIPMKFITKYPFNGKVNGTIHLQGKKSSSIKEFLTNLGGTIHLHITDGNINFSNKNPVPFSHLYINCETNNKTPQSCSEKVPLYTPYIGHWNIVFLSPTWEGSLIMNGPISFSTKTFLPYRADNIPSTITYSCPNKPVTQMDGNLSFNLETGLVTINQLNNNNKTTQLSGNIKIDKYPILEGFLKITTNKPHILLSQLGYSINNSFQAINNVYIQGNFFISPLTIQLSNVSGVIDQTTFDLSLQGKRTTDPPKWEGTLNIESLDLDKYFSVFHKNTNPEKPWPIKLLYYTDIEGSINIKNIKYHMLNYKDVTVPISLTQGRLLLKPITASLYGGKTNADISIHEIKNGSIFIKVHYFSKNIDMLTLTQNRNQPYIISGNGLLNLELETTSSSKKDMIKNLQGNLRIFIQQGFLKGTKSNITKNFSTLSSNSMITNGILKTKDATLVGPGLAVKGSGFIDFSQWNIDYNILVDLGNLNATIPIHYFGNLNNLQYRINPTSFIIGTISSLGNDTIGIIENIFLVPIKLFLK